MIDETFNFESAITWHKDQVRALRTPTGLFIASNAGVSTGYNKAWLRDVCFMSLAFEKTEEWDVVMSAASALLGILCKHSDKINWAVRNKPHESWQYIHARYNPETFEEYWEDWGNKQNDAVGEILFLIANLELTGHGVVKTDKDRKMLQTLVDYLCSIEYWQDADSGIWEESAEVHASSIGAVLAGLRKVNQLDYVTVDDYSFKMAEEALQKLLPRESSGKFCDLSLLSLIYPFEVVTDEQRDAILKNVEYFLVRDKGVIRYKNDKYYNANDDGYSEEAEWPMGLSWLAIIYARLGDVDKAKDYLERATGGVNHEGKIPELYFSHQGKSNENIPLGWSESMYVVALVEVQHAINNG